MDVIERYGNSDSRALIEISSAPSSAPAARLLDVAKKKKDEIIIDAMLNPTHSNDLKKDIVYRLGMAAGIEWVISQPKIAKKYIDMMDREG